jgi:beta-xylosidase
MREWLCFSSTNLTDWTEHPSPLKANDFSWADGDAFASKVLACKDKFYWFASVNHKTQFGKAIGLAVADAPQGPFVDAIGSALITHDMLPPTSHENANLDPTVLVDDDGSIHIFWGNGKCYHAKLNKDMTGIDGDIEVLSLPSFTEGAHIHKRQGIYYLAYGFGYPEKVAYMISTDPNGGWTYKGILNELAGNCATNRPAIIDFKGGSYFFYHNGALPDGDSFRRSVCVDRLYYNEDLSIKRVIMTSEGVDTLA